MKTTLSNHRCAAAAFLIAVVLLTASACGNDSPQRESRFVLGTTSTITVFDRTVPRGLIDRVFDRVSEIESRMSINESNWDDTELMRINRSAGRAPVAVSEDTFAVIEAGVRLSEATNGAFDITVGPLILLWGIGTPRERVPSEAEIEAVLPLIDYSRVELDAKARTVYLPLEGMAIDVGGIAKGFAVEEAARLLRESGVQHAVLDFGGDIYTVGIRRDGDPWRIGLQNPDSGRGSIIGIINSSDNAVVTSGAYERFFVEDGHRYHHLFDVTTGHPARNSLTSVTAMANDAMVADVYSTAGYIVGLEDGLRLFNDSVEVEGIFVTEDRTVHVTPGMEGVFRISGDDFRRAEVHDLSANGRYVETIR